MREIWKSYGMHKYKSWLSRNRRMRKVKARAPESTLRDPRIIMKEQLRQVSFRCKRKRLSCKWVEGTLYPSPVPPDKTGGEIKIE